MRGDLTSRLRFVTTGGTFPFPDGGSNHRIWVVEQDDEAPLAVIASIMDEAHRGWIDVTDELLSTVEFGEIAPTPASFDSQDAWVRGADRASVLRWPDVPLDES